MRVGEAWRGLRPGVREGSGTVTVSRCVHDGPVPGGQGALGLCGCLVPGWPWCLESKWVSASPNMGLGSAVDEDRVRQVESGFEWVWDSSGTGPGVWWWMDLAWSVV